MPFLDKWAGTVVPLTLIAIGLMGIYESFFEAKEGEGHGHGEEEAAAVNLALAGERTCVAVWLCVAAWVCGCARACVVLGKHKERERAIVSCDWRCLEPHAGTPTGGGSVAGGKSAQSGLKAGFATYATGQSGPGAGGPGPGGWRPQSSRMKGPGITSGVMRTWLGACSSHRGPTAQTCHHMRPSLHSKNHDRICYLRALLVTTHTHTRTHMCAPTSVQASCTGCSRTRCLW